MKLRTNVLSQIVMTIIQGANQTIDLVPQKGKFWVAIGVGVMQLAGAVLAHASNPDGTDAQLPYTPPEK